MNVIFRSIGLRLSHGCRQDTAQAALTLDLKKRMRLAGSTGILPATQKGRAFAAISMATPARNAASVSYSDDCLRRRNFAGEEGALVGGCSTSKSADMFLGNGSALALRLDVEDEDEDDATDIVDGGTAVADGIKDYCD